MVLEVHILSKRLYYCTGINLAYSDLDGFISSIPFFLFFFLYKKNFKSCSTSIYNLSNYEICRL